VSIIRKFICIIVVILISGMFLSATVASSNNVKIGYVDVDEVYQSHPATAEINLDIQEKVKSLQEQFGEKTQGLDQEKDQEEIQQLQQQFQSQLDIYQKEQIEKLHEIVKPELDNIRKILGLDLLLNKEVVVSGGKDVTKEVIQHFN